MKKTIILLITCLLCCCMYMTAYALEITEEYIQKYGIPSVDENGNETVLIPLYSISEMEYEPEVLPEDHAGCVPEENGLTRHYHPLVHTHQITNVNTTTAYISKPISYWADQGFQITWTSGWSVSISLSLDLKSGIPKSTVERNFGVTVGGSYTYTESNAYTSPVIPQGYEGRISVRIVFTRYTFDDTITYYSDSVPVYTIEETIRGNIAEGEPYDKIVYLELRPRTFQ